MFYEPLKGVQYNGQVLILHLSTVRNVSKVPFPRTQLCTVAVIMGIHLLVPKVTIQQKCLSLDQKVFYVKVFDLQKHDLFSFIIRNPETMDTFHLIILLLNTIKIKHRQNNQSLHKANIVHLGYNEIDGAAGQCSFYLRWLY